MKDRKILMLFPVLILLWIGLSPKGTIPGIQHFSYLVIFALASTSLFLKHREIQITQNGLIFVLAFLVWWLATLISFTINITEIRLGAIFEVGRPILFAALFLCGYTTMRENGSHNWHRTMIVVAKILILFMLCISTVQLFSADFFSSIWSSVKTRGLGSLVRVTGTMYNPNSLAYFVSFLCFGIISHQGIKRSWFWIIITMSLLVLASSRTLMLAFPAALAIMYWMKAVQQNILVGSLKMSILFALFIAVFYSGIYLFSDHLPYASQLLSLFSIDASASDVHSFSVRESQWKTKIDFWLDKGGLSILFGAGSVPQLQVGDNDFIFTITRLGIFGTIIHILLYCILFFISWKARISAVGLWLTGIMTITLISGLTIESLSGWQPPIYAFLIAGAAYAIIESRETRSSVIKYLEYEDISYQQ